MGVLRCAASSPGLLSVVGPEFVVVQGLLSAVGGEAFKWGVTAAGRMVGFSAALC